MNAPLDHRPDRTPLSPTERRPAVAHPAGALARPSPRQALNLSVAVAGTIGGTVLFGVNVAGAVLAGSGAIPWLSLAANLALIGGSLMFACEYRRRRQTLPSQATDVD